MLKAIRWLVVAFLACMALPLLAQCTGGACTLAVSVSTATGGVTLGGSGTATTTMALGTMKAFKGTVPAGVTVTAGATSWTISSFFDIKVTCTVVIGLVACNAGNSPSYVLSAQLSSVDGTNTWKVSGLTLSGSSATTIATSNTYSQAYTYTFSLTIPFSEAPGNLNDTINLIATSN